MSVQINLPPVLQTLVGDIKQINVTGRTVGECLEALVKQYPGLKSRLLKKNNRLPKGINIFINGENTYPEPLTKRVHEGDKVYISYIVLGG